MGYEFLSEEWVKAVRVIRDEYDGPDPGRRAARPAGQPRDHRRAATGRRARTTGTVHAHADTSGRPLVLDLGALPDPDLTVTVDYDTAYALLVEQRPERRPRRVPDGAHQGLGGRHRAHRGARPRPQRAARPAGEPRGHRQLHARRPRPRRRRDRRPDPRHHGLTQPLSGPPDPIGPSRSGRPRHHPFGWRVDKARTADRPIGIQRSPEKNKFGGGIDGPGDMELTRAYAILGVGDESSLEDVRTAFVTWWYLYSGSPMLGGTRGRPRAEHGGLGRPGHDARAARAGHGVARDRAGARRAARSAPRARRAARSAGRPGATRVTFTRLKPRRSARPDGGHLVRAVPRLRTRHVPRHRGGEAAAAGLSSRRCCNARVVKRNAAEARALRRSTLSAATSSTRAPPWATRPAASRVASGWSRG